MNKEDLANKITIFINDCFMINNEEYKFKSIYECYNNANNDLLYIGFKILKSLNLNMNNLDYMITDDYFIFNYKNSYIIINFFIDIWNICEYKILIVNTRNEALRYRYG